MTDISKFVRDRDAAEAQGHLLELGDWSESIALQTAKEMGLEMTDEHWAVVRFLREHYRDNGQAPNARTLLDVLDDRFAAQGGRKYLYRIFPNGPVSQGSKIAGLPLPDYSQDPSFGTSS